MKIDDGRSAVRNADVSSRGSRICMSTCVVCVPTSYEGEEMENARDQGWNLWESRIGIGQDRKIWELEEYLKL